MAEKKVKKEKTPAYLKLYEVMRAYGEYYEANFVDKFPFEIHTIDKNNKKVKYVLIIGSETDVSTNWHKEISMDKLMDFLEGVSGTVAEATGWKKQNYVTALTKALEAEVKRIAKKFPRLLDLLDNEKN